MLAVFDIIDSDAIPAKKPKADTHSQTTGSSYQGFIVQSTNRSSTGSIESFSSSPSPSTASFPNSKDWFKRLASNTSVSPSSLGSGSNNTDSNNEMIELISRCLQKCGEEDGYMPLFKVIFTTLTDVSENRYTRLLDGRAKDILLTGVITRIVHYASKHVQLVFICNDMQCKYNLKKLL